MCTHFHTTHTSCKIWDTNNSAAEDASLLGCDTMWSGGNLLTFHRLHFHTLQGRKLLPDHMTSYSKKIVIFTEIQAIKK